MLKEFLKKLILESMRKMKAAQIIISLFTVFAFNLEEYNLYLVHGEVQQERHYLYNT